MADTVKISGLPSATTTTGADYVPIVQGGITKKAPLNVLGTGAGIDAVSDIGLQAHWSMDSVPEIPDDPAGVTYLQDAWLTVDGWAGNATNPTVSNGVLLCHTLGIYKVVPFSVGETLRVKVKSLSGSQIINAYFSGGGGELFSQSVGTKYEIINVRIPSGALGALVIGSSATADFEIDFIYIGTGAYLPNSLIDNSGNGNHGTIYGATPVEGISGRALAFDGAKAYCKAALSGFTTKLLLNLYLSDLVYDGGIILESSPNFNTYDGAFILYTNTTQNSIICTYHGSGGVGGAYLGGVISVPSGEFMLSIEIDTSIATTDAMKAFVNGIQVAISFVNTSINRVPLYNGDLYMGSRNGTSIFLNGTIDEPRIYDRALSAEEVYSLYMSKGRGPDAQVKSVRGVANSLVVRNSSGQLQDMADYGIGVTAASVMVTSLDTYKTNGIFTDPAGSLINSPFVDGANGGATVFVQAFSTAYISQLAVAASYTALARRMRIRWCENGTWTAWFNIWTSASDGNGGQPPSPKPTTGAPAGGANAQGQFIYGTVLENGNFYFSGTSNLAGTWMINIQTYINSTGLPNYTLFSLAIGSGAWFTVPAGNTTNWQAWRIA